MFNDRETTGAVAHAQSIDDEETVALHCPANGAGLDEVAWNRGPETSLVKTTHSCLPLHVSVRLPLRGTGARGQVLATPWSTDRQVAASGGSAVSRGVYGWSTRKDGRANRRMTAFFLGQVETPDRLPAGSAGVDLRRHMNGARAAERDNGVIKIVVVPVA